MTITNASGDMYTQNTFVSQDNNTGTAFANSGNKSYTNFASGKTHPHKITELEVALPRL